MQLAPVVTATTIRNNFSSVAQQITQSKGLMLVSKRGNISSALIDIELLEDLLALTDTDYLDSIKQARQEYEKGEVLTHQQVFGDV